MILERGLAMSTEPQPSSRSSSLPPYRNGDRASTCQEWEEVVFTAEVKLAIVLPKEVRGDGGPSEERPLLARVVSVLLRGEEG